MDEQARQSAGELQCVTQRGEGYLYSIDPIHLLVRYVLNKIKLQEALQN